MIRAGTIVQLLLGNIGRPGGGVMAMRGHASIQGSSDIPTLYELLPGYLPMPRAAEGEFTLQSYVERGGTDRGWWSHFDNYIVSLLKAWFGDAATPENGFGFACLPKINGNHSHFSTIMRALDGELDGLFVMGQNPAVGCSTPGCSGARSPASSGSSCATWPTPRPRASGRTRRRSQSGELRRRRSRPRSS